MRKCAFAICLFVMCVMLPATSATAVENSSSVDFDITFTLLSVEFTDGGDAFFDTDYTLDGPSYSFFHNINSFVFTEGDGTGSIAGTVTVGPETHTYPASPMDFDFDPSSEDLVMDVSTNGASSAPSSNGSAAIEPNFTLFLEVFEDPEELVIPSLTFTFGYTYNADVTLVKDFEDGSANAFIDVGIGLTEEAGSTLSPEIDLTFIGPGESVSGLTDSGQFELVTTGGETEDDAFIQIVFITNINSTTLVNTVPEPASAAMLGAGALALTCIRRRR